MEFVIRKHNTHFSNQAKQKSANTIAFSPKSLCSKVHATPETFFVSFVAFVASHSFKRRENTFDLFLVLGVYKVEVVRSGL